MFVPFIKRFEIKVLQKSQLKAITSLQEQQSFDYYKLNSYANKVAHYLTSLGITKGNIVGFSSDRSVNSYIVILALFKLGVIVVPLDLEYPSDFLNFIIQDSKLSYIISSSNLFEVSINVSVINLSKFFETIKDTNLREDNLIIDIAYEDLVYVIYTSGSTGKPKGVCMSQGALANFLSWEENYYEHLDNERVLQFSPLNFDIFFQECLTTWATGKELILVPKQYRAQPSELLKVITKENVNKLIVPYIILVQLAQVSAINNTYPKSLKKIISVAEAFISTPAINNLMQTLTTCKFYNLYGASENQVVSIYELKQSNGPKIIPIGVPVVNSKVFILDEDFKLVNHDQIGILHVASNLLATCYLNKPDLTAEKFIANPFQTEEEKQNNIGTRLYRTGDLVRWLPDGNLEYIGRSDFQVKIRGYRIELGEIESVLSLFEGIKQCVVLARGHVNSEGHLTGNKYLVGYYVSEEKLNETKILIYLQSKLPEYMVPTVLVYLTHLPLTMNGKLDRKALPDPEFTSVDLYVAPRSEVETRVRDIWAELLGLASDQVGIRDDFFRLGGDSIVSIQVVSRVRQILGVNVSIKDIFNYRTIERLFDTVINKVNDKLVIKSEQGVLSGEVKLLPVQEWFFANKYKNPNYWNQSFLIKTPKLEIEKLINIIKKLVSYHDSFRLRYKKEKGSKKDKYNNAYIQYYDENISVKEINILDIRTLGAKEGTSEFQEKLDQILTGWQSGFDIESTPLYSIGYLHGYKDNSTRLHFAMHHLIVDTVSWRIIAEDLKNLYEERELGSKGTSYRQWVDVIRAYPEKYSQEKEYWNNVLSNYKLSILDQLVVSKDNYTSFELDLMTTKQLLQDSSRAYNTQINDILLTGLGYVLSEITGSDVNYIILEGHGREELDNAIDITKTVGWFTTIYPVKLEVQEELGSSIKAIKEMFRQIPNKGVGYGVFFGYNSKILPKISFNYLGQFDKSETNNIWSITGESGGRSIDPDNINHNIIDINGLVVDGKLQFNIATKLDRLTTIKLRDLFKKKLEDLIIYTVNRRNYLTVSDIDNIISQDYLDRLQENREVEAVYLANSLQQGFIYHVLNQGDIDDAYLGQCIWQYNNELEVGKLKEAWRCTQAKYSALRLRLIWEEEIVQVIDKEGILDWRYINLSAEHNLKVQEYKIKEIQASDRAEPYKLEHGNLFRVYIIKQREDLYTCIFSVHHIILDGWSETILLDYMHETYFALLDDKRVIIELDDSYGKAQKYIQEHELDNKEYWDNYISKIEERLDLSGLLSNERRQEGIKISEYKHIKDPRTEILIIEKDLYRGIKEVSQREGVTLNSILQYVWHKILHIYGNSQNTVVGTTIAGRNIPVDDIESSVGLYVNTLPLIVTHEKKQKSIIEAIRDIQRDINEINSRSNVNLAKLQKEGKRLFDSLFTYQNYPSPINPVYQDRFNISFKAPVEKVDYPLWVLVCEANNKLMFRLSYAGELFIKDYVKYLIPIVKILINQIVINPKQEEKYLNYLNEDQYNQIVKECNQTNKDYPANKTIHQLFEEQVEKTPNNIALVFEYTKLTYRELNERANRLANYLRKYHKIKPDMLVVLCLDRSEYMLIGILAVLKAGGAYVPMYTNYPDDRIEYILHDTGTQIVLTNQIYKERLIDIASISILTKQIKVLPIDNILFQNQLLIQSIQTPVTTTLSSNLAYVIYTSGTTGNSKGVLQVHSNVMRLFTATCDWYDFNKSDVWTLFHSYVFDFSVWEIWGALIYGGKLVIPSYDQTRDPSIFYELCKREQVTVLNQTPSAFYQFIDIAISKEKADKLVKLRYVIFGGEALSLLQLKPWFDFYGYDQPKLINMYGITETTVHVTYKIIEEALSESSNIGRIIPDLTAYVLDDNLTPLPIGAIGELYVGGAGLARGYLNNSALTAERFIANHFQIEKERRLGENSRLYRTGDLVRWLPDSNLEYIGRNDFQVKIRGYRIELGEVETVLSSYEGVRQGVVIAKEHKNIDGQSNSNKYLVGYYVSDEVLDKQKIIDYLQSKLPDYMVPSILVHLTKLPLTVNGKLDRKSLPDPKFVDTDNYVAPRNELESAVCKIWSEVLGLPEDKVGARDDFFRLGGDSIISIQLISRIKQRLSLNLSIKDIFNYKTIEKLYDNVLSKNFDNKIQTKSERGILKGGVDLLSIQTWFFENNFAKASHWNQSFLIKTPVLNLEKLKNCLEQLVSHHDAFRLKYRKDKNNQYIQYYDNKAKAEELKVLDIRQLAFSEGTKEFNEKLHEIFTSWQNDFNLEYGPFYRISYIYGYEDGSSRIYFALHHLIVDAVSWRILAEDLRTLYDDKELEPKGSSYRQWVAAVKKYATTHESEKDYWTNILAGYDSDNNILTKLLVSENTCNYASLQLSQERTKQLLQESNRAYHTQINDLLLTALGYALSELTGNRTNYLVLEGHGREEIDSSIDITRTLGWFTTMYPVRLEINEEAGNSIKYIKETLRQIPNKGIGYGALFGYGLNKLPRVSFNYLGQFDQGQEGISNFWNITDESSGIQVNILNYDNNVLNINGLVINGKLKFSIASKLNNEVTGKLANLFQDKLNEIINYTANETRSYLTASDIDNIINQEYLDRLQQTKEIEGVYLANSLQQGFIYHYLSQKDLDDAYRVQSVRQYANNLDPEKLKQAWEYAQGKYGALRLRFAWEEELVQIIDKKSNLDWRYIDLSDKADEKVQNTKIIDIQERDREEVYRLEKGNLFRVYLIKQREGLYTCLFSSHHAILDGWSNPVLLSYIHETYLKLCDQQLIELSVDQVYEEAQKFLHGHTNDDKDYWNGYLGQIEDRSNLSCLLSNESRSKNIRISEYRHIQKSKELTLIIKDELYKELKALSQKEGVTLNAITQYAWHKTLDIYSQSSQTVVGTTLSGRTLPINNIEYAVGLFINTLPVIVNHHKNNESKESRRIIEIIKNIQDDINEINNRSNINLITLQKEGQRLFDSLFVYENYPVPVNEEQQRRLEVNFITGIEKLDYPLGAMAYDTDNSLTFKLKYASEIFDADIIQGLPLIIEKLLKQITINPVQQETSLNYLNEIQYQQIICNWNKTDKRYPRDKTIHQLFEEQVVKTPDSIAVVYEDIQLTYKELNARSNQLANYLMATQDMRPDTLVALCLDRSEHILIAILGVLKVGGAYVPMDPSYPDERIKYILGDTDAKVVLTNEVYKQRLQAIAKQVTEYLDNPENIQAEILAIDSALIQEPLSSQITDNPDTDTTSSNLAYVIYTSGTTGNPKGVMIQHTGVVNTVLSQFHYLSIENLFIQDTSCGFFTNYVFDASVAGILLPLISGYKLVVSKQLSQIDISEFINKNQTNIVNCAQILSLLEDNITSLKCLIIGGEKQDQYLLTRVISSGIKIFQEYGLTESSIVNSYTKLDFTAKVTNIGSPIYNNKCYVLDDNLIPLPIGVIGELYIGGVGLARGYLNRPDLTAEKFIANPFQSIEEMNLHQNVRLYKTGDLVRWLPDGNLEYIGRNDFQVKIRGYRIELGQIERILSSYVGIKQSVVLAKEHKDATNQTSSNKYLVGYYVSDEVLDKQKIIDYLQSKLPDYMVPSILVHLTKLPLTVNGKLDRKSLPDPKFVDTDNYVAPRNELEVAVCKIWSEVLGLPEDKLGILDNFFRLGGNSIQVIRLVSKINKKLYNNISVTAIFQQNTVEKLAKYLKHNIADNVTISKTITSRVEDQLLSFAQERLWFIEKYEQGTNAYNIPMVFKLSDGTQLNILENCINSIIARHEVLRTLIKEDNEGNSYQLVLDNKVQPLEIFKIKVLTQAKLDQELRKAINHVYDLSSEYPIRVSLYELTSNNNSNITEENNKEYYLSIVIHHIAFDGWSIDIFLNELKIYYQYYLKQLNQLEAPLDLPNLTIQYKDFALWQRSYLSGERLGKQLDYWKDKLKGYETLNLITDKARPNQIDYKGADVYFEIDKDTSNSLRELAKELKVSLYSLLLAAYYLMLRIYSNQDDIVVGTPIANRHHSQIENLIGFFVNTLALRSKIESKTLLKDYIQEVGREIVAAQIHQDLPFERLVEELNVVKDTSRQAIFQVMFGVQNFGSDVVDDGLLLEPYVSLANSYNIAKFDISTFIDDTVVSLKGSFNYAVSLYEEDTIKGFIQTYTKILKQFSELSNNIQGQEQTKIADLSYLNQEQYEEIVYNWNDTDKFYPNNKTIQELFEEQVEKTPDSIAAVYKNEAITYQQLNCQTNKLAHYFRRLMGASPEIIIAVCLKQPISMVIGMLATMKSSGSYLPIDYNYSEERINFILQDSRVSILLTQDDLVYKFRRYIGNMLTLDSDSRKVAQESELNPIVLTDLNNLAYIIYTSGSTGQPKGVMIEHKSLINFIASLGTLDSIGLGDYFLQNVSFCFDPSMWTTIWPLIQGATLITATNEQIKDPEFTIKCITRHSIKVFHVGPSLFRMIFSHHKINKCRSLKHILGGGEAWNTGDIHLVKENLSRCCFTNVYGPTEATIHIATWVYQSQDIITNTIPIGKPIINSQIYVLDSDLAPLPIGAVGELYVGGVGLARGYLNRPELTSEKFIANPFQREEEKAENKNTRLYMTGDLVRWLPDGNLEYIGRNDFQVKIRGYRIELGEIENTLALYKGVKQTVVLAKDHRNVDGTDSDNKHLVGYYVADNQLDEEKILNYLQDKLPEYMVPSALVYLEKLPLTINGKLDRKALPDPEFTDSKTYAAPRNELEAALCKIWSEVLGLPEDKVGIRDDFFRLGGNSIAAIKLVSRLNKELNINVTVAVIFKASTTEKLAFLLTKLDAEDDAVITRATVERPKDQRLSFAQERLWFIEKYEQGTNAYNIPMVFKLLEDVKLDILEHSIGSVISRHEILHSLIKEDQDGNGYQVVSNLYEKLFEVRKVNVKGELEFKVVVEEEVNHIYDLSREYPVKVCIYELTDSKFDQKVYYISIVIHHIAFDGWSVDILLKELSEYYNYYKKQSQGDIAELNLSELSIQYKDFALWQRSYLSGERLRKQLDYWKDKLEGYETLNLITDKPRPNQIDYKGADVYFEIDKDTSTALRELAKELKVSLYSLLLAAYYLMLRSYSNQDDIVVGTPIANRHHSQIESLIGFFVNTLALRSKIESKTLLKYYIQEIGREIAAAQLHQDLPFERLVEELNVVKDTSRQAIFQVMFGVQNFGSGVVDDSLLLESYVNLANSYNIAKFDISTSIDDTGVSLKGSFNYAVSLYKEDTITRFIQTYTMVLQQLAGLVNNVNKQQKFKIENLTYLTVEQYQQIIYSWNKTDKEYPRDKTIHQLFEEQVERTPKNLALVYEDTKLTYRELNERANRLARYLVEKYDIKPDALVALCLDRSEHMLVAILAVLKAGGAYVPMDPTYPEERIKYILEDTKAIVVLTDEIYKQRLKELSCDINSQKTTIVAVDSNEVQQLLLLQSSVNLQTSATSTSLAYVIYTSGTTGKPKGVMINHEAYAAVINSIKNSYFKNKQKVSTYSLTNYVFDIFGLEYGLPLLSGGIISIGTNKFKFLDCLNYDFVQITPSLCSVKLNYLINTSNIQLFIGGESLGYDLLKKVLSKSINVVNVYGPTESTIWSASKLYDYKDINKLSFVSFGTAHNNEKCYVLDTNLNPLPIGAVGELYVGGVGLARGYLNRPELTSEKFIANPFQREEEKAENKNTRLYMTGDLVRWLPDGNLEYIGRNDFQVKIRGYRIELGEIENTLALYKGVKQTVVLEKDHRNVDGANSDNKYLVGYYVADNQLDEEKILNYLQDKLPEYMVPDVLVYLEKLPLTINGKLDRKELPDPEFTSNEAYISPRNELEAQICKIWTEILSLPEGKVGIRDDFFKLGGNSILAIKLISKINSYYQSHLKVADIFAYKNIELLLKIITQTRDSYQTIVKLNNSYDKSNMFMIHPATGGCEVYISLANTLTNYFSCYGVDSYNLYNKNKVDNLNKLAQYYLTHIDEIMIKTQQEVYHLFGWSLGGQIALEIASILEQKGDTKIKVYLLDTALGDNYLLSLRHSINSKELENTMKDYMMSRGYEEAYIEKVILNIDTEQMLSKQTITSLLANTQIVLFKAMLKDTRFAIDNFKKQQKYIHTLEYNNIDSVTRFRSNIRLVKIYNAHHGNILNYEEILVKALIGL